VKAGDLVTYKSVFKRADRLRKRGLHPALGVVVYVQICPISVTYPVWVSWNFLNNDIREQNSYQLEVINESW
jgi:hypothetical protein